MRSRSLPLVLGLVSAAPPLRAQTQRFADLHRMFPPDEDGTVALAFGDVDGDGDLDLFLVNSDPYFVEQHRVYLNEGSGAFAAAPSQPPVNPYGGAQALALGDVEGDGDLDALVGNFGQPCGLLLNNGSGVFTDASAQLPPIIRPTRAVVLADLDADGDLDALIGNDAQQNRFYENTGAGLFFDATWRLPGVYIRTYALAVGDVDGDGDLDILVGNGEPGPFAFNRLQLNDGTGFFTDATGQVPLISGTTRSLALGDVDGDGDLDALLGNDLASQNLLHLNDGTGVFTDATSQLPAILEDTKALAFGDVDGDGDVDALVGNDGLSRLYVNNGSGSFTNATSQLPPTLGVVRSLALSDVDGDGDFDAFIGNAGTQKRLYLNDGAGSFTDATSQPPPDAQATRALALGDVDGDGDLDADSYAVAVGDVDADGDLDDLIGNDAVINPLLAGQERLYLNAGNGVFADATSQLPTIPTFTRAVALGDVDADGDLDALIGNYAGINPFVGGQERLYLNDGTGSFTDATTQLPSSFDFTYAVALGDVDGDGDLDALIGNNPSSNRLLLNDGTGVFADASGQLPPGNYWARALAFGDVDGDGDLDVVTGNAAPGGFGVQNRLYLNNGSGVFAEAAAALPPILDVTNAVALGDVDGDGDLDAVFGNFEEPSRLPVFNLTRQIAWRAIPGIGKPLLLDLRGPASVGWLLAASMGTASIPLPPFGTLRLAPATLITVAAGVTDPDGRASVSFAVPANPALLGVSVYWQALVGLPLRLTNLEVTTFTNL